MKLGTRQVMAGLRNLRATTHNPYAHRRGSIKRKQLAAAHKSNRRLRGAKKHRSHIASRYGWGVEP